MTAWGGAWDAAWGDAWGANGLQARDLIIGPVVLSRPAAAEPAPQGAFLMLLDRRTYALEARSLQVGRVVLGAPRPSLRMSPAQIALLAEADARAAALADEEDAIIALLLAA